MGDMRITKIIFLGFLSMFVLGCASCVPGICGCGLSVWPSSWEQWITIPALIADVVSLAGMAVCATVWFILWMKRRAIA